MQRITDCLNSLLAVDPAAAGALVEARVPYAGDPAAAAPFVLYDDGKGGPPMIGLLGLLNGVLAAAGCKLYACYDSETKRLFEFVIRNNIEKPAPAGP